MFTLRNSISILTIIDIQHYTEGLKEKMIEKWWKGKKMSSVNHMVICIDNTRRDTKITGIIMEICQGRNYIRFSSVQLLSHAWLFVTPWTAARQASLSITNSWSLLKLMSITLMMSSNHHKIYTQKNNCISIHQQQTENPIFLRYYLYKQLKIDGTLKYT